MKKTAFIFLLLCLAAFLPAEAQNDFGGDSRSSASIEGKAAIDSLLSSDATAETALLFDKTTQDLGTLTEDQDPISVMFHFKNIGSETVNITKVVTTCGCTEAFAEPTMVEAGSEGNVTMTFSPRNRLGMNDVRAFVYTSEHEGAEEADGALMSSRLPAARLSLTGEVVETSPWSHYPFKMGPLRLMRNDVTLTLTGAAGKAVERILCANAGPKPLILSADGLPPYARFRTEPETIEPGEEADLVISIDMEAVTEWNRNVQGFSFLVTGAVARPGPDEMIEVIIKNEK